MCPQKVNERISKNMNDSYESFIDRKRHVGGEYGFDPTWMPDQLFDFQRAIVQWATRKGRAAIFADCGLGKTFMQLAWAENVARHTGGRVLILTPLAVSFQTVTEGEKIGVEAIHRRDGIKQGDRIIVTNYERLHYFNADDFDGVVCDESSILKNFDGKTRKAVTDFMRKRPYLLLCTATAAPNDYIELGTSSEALGELERKHMMAQFFTHDGGDTSKWVLKGHARSGLFWRWVCTWARALRQPSDMGYSNDGFVLPPLNERSHVVSATRPLDGYLFDVPAVGLDEQRCDLRRTIAERCGMAADLINAHNAPSVAWCNLNAESDQLAKMIPGAVEVQGSDSEEKKEESFIGFTSGDIRVLITKPSIAGFGMNWQHCAHMTFFPSHSYEQYYQCTRRCWRFGQKNAVNVDMITTDGQSNVMRNMQRKSAQAIHMFDVMTGMMWKELKIEKREIANKKVEVASWL
jgi:hypothetical protein